MEEIIYYKAKDGSVFEPDKKEKCVEYEKLLDELLPLANRVGYDFDKLQVKSFKGHEQHYVWHFNGDPLLVLAFRTDAFKLLKKLWNFYADMESLLKERTNDQYDEMISGNSTFDYTERLLGSVDKKFVAFRNFSEMFNCIDKSGREFVNHAQKDCYEYYNRQGEAKYHFSEVNSFFD